MTLQDLIKPRKYHKAINPQNMKPRDHSDANKAFKAYFESQSVPVEKTTVIKELNITPEQFNARMTFLRAIGLNMKKMHVGNKVWAYWIEKDEHQ